MSGFRRFLFRTIFAGFSCFFSQIIWAEGDDVSVEELTQINSLFDSVDQSEDFLRCETLTRKIQLRTTIDFFAVDLKYDHGKIKVLEFQDGPQAGLRAYDEVFEKGGIWRMFWDWLNQFNVPIWYVGVMPKEVPNGQFSHYDKDRIAFDYFIQKIGWYSHNLASLERDHKFRRCLRQKSKKGLFAGCKAIILLKDQPSRNVVNQFKRKYPECIIVNQNSRRHTNNKLIADLLFQDDLLKEFRPYARRFPKEYSARMARDIINEFQSECYMIKPINSSRSNGVIMTDKQDLDAVLKKVLIEKQNRRKNGHGSYRPGKTLTYDYWLGDRNRAFLVEKYEPSQSISVNGQLYDPTMRALCVMYSVDGEIKVEILEAFWKVPLMPLSSQGDLTETHVSKHRPDLTQLSKEDLAVKPDDMIELRKNLTSVISKVYLKMLMS